MHQWYIELIVCTIMFEAVVSLTRRCGARVSSHLRATASTAEIAMARASAEGNGRRKSMSFSRTTARRQCELKLDSTRPGAGPWALIKNDVDNFPFLELRSGSGPIRWLELGA